MAHRDVKGAEGALDGIVLTNSYDLNSTCETCARGKIKTLPFPSKSETRAVRPLNAYTLTSKVRLLVVTVVSASSFPSSTTSLDIAGYICYLLKMK
jgi:hypothetical protein